MDLSQLLTDIDTTLETYSEGVPFGNSDTQNIALVVGQEFSPGRQLRAYLLRLWNRRRAFQEGLYTLKKLSVELKKLERDLQATTDELDKELIKLEIEKRISDLKYHKKLFLDCIREMVVLTEAIKQFPVISRHEFEKQELEHFAKRLTLQLTQPEQITSLQSLGFKIEGTVGNQIQLSYVGHQFMEHVINNTEKLCSELASLNGNDNSLDQVSNIEFVSKALQEIYNNINNIEEVE